MTGGDAKVSAYGAPFNIPLVRQSDHQAALAAAQAEIGRDSERVDWLEEMRVGVDYREEMGWGVYDIIEGILGEAPTIRAAIDAAREVG